MTTTKVLEHLKKYGQLLDSEIARATKLPLAEVQASIMELSALGEISKCSVTSYIKGRPVEHLQCRISGFVPRPAPGRKPAAR
ncbi:MAG: transcriptional regulator [Azonexus sp.]|nr:transcriptional regulator [Azonexus sp.]MCK6410821.1 transcriptional regulator [Azonexus sp.]